MASCNHCGVEVTLRVVPVLPVVPELVCVEDPVVLAAVWFVEVPVVVPDVWFVEVPPVVPDVWFVEVPVVRESLVPPVLTAEVVALVPEEAEDPTTEEGELET
jgi:hypothetical protein